MPHQHKWKIVSTDYNPPYTIQTQGGVDIPEDLMEKAVMGTTHIYQKCEICGEIKQQDVIGRFEPNQEN